MADETPTRRFASYIYYALRRIILDVWPDCADNDIYDAMHIRMVPWGELNLSAGDACAVIEINQFTRTTAAGAANVAYRVGITLYYIRKIGQAPTSPIMDRLEAMREALEPLGGLESQEPPFVIQGDWQTGTVGDYACNDSLEVNRVLEIRKDGVRAGQIALNLLVFYPVNPAAATQFPILPSAS